MRRAAKVDANHSEVVAALRAAGAFVVSLAAHGDGCPDLLVGARGRFVLLEVKDGRRPPSERKLRPAQVAFIAAARARGLPVFVVTSAEEALAALVDKERPGVLVTLEGR